MATLTIQTVTEAGIEPTYAAVAGGGDVVANLRGDVVLHVKNGAGASMTVTVTAQQTTKSVPGFGALTKASVAVAVPAGEERLIGPFPKSAFNNASGNLAITYSSPTTVTIAALRVPAAA